MALNSYYIWRQTETKKLKHTAWHDKGNTKRKKEKKPDWLSKSCLTTGSLAEMKKKEDYAWKREREGGGGKVQLFHQDKLGEKKKSKALNHSHIRKVMRKKNSSTINATQNRKSTSNLLLKGCQGKNCKKKKYSALIFFLEFLRCFKLWYVQIKYKRHREISSTE